MTNLVKSVVEVKLSDIIAEVGVEKACYFFPGKVPMSLIEQVPTFNLMVYCGECADLMSVSVLEEIIERRLDKIAILEPKERLEEIKTVLFRLGLTGMYENFGELKATRLRAEQMFTEAFAELFVFDQVAAVCFVLSLDKKREKNVVEKIFTDYPFTVTMDQ